MNTKTMRLPPRRFLTSNNNKRKDREGFDTLKPTPPTPVLTKLPKPVISHQVIDSAESPVFSPGSSNHLLAGYLAHEFLTKGTLFSQPWDPARAESTTSSGLEANNNNSKKLKPSQKGREAEPSKEKANYQRYVEVSHLLKGESGGHLPGVFNPSQLARLLQM
ncbi:uncharacterized protein LOC126654663 [Mercurialis annua]|uniref:uncharacterized protein LOC126654663 n=1 Tax=Mercurialis annua TaxID=3986 RepID=UPI0021610B60|nr:uncharacterized protein LOC126654663 [Mercurialis annua]